MPPGASMRRLVQALAALWGASLADGGTLRNAFHKIAALGDYLYVEGGEVAMDGENASIPTNGTFSLPLGHSWEMASVKSHRARGRTVQPFRAFALWADPATGQLYHHGGEMPGSEPLVKDHRGLWAFSPNGGGGGDWDKLPASNLAVANSFQATTRAASDFCAGTGFLVGGWASGATDHDLYDNVSVPSRLVRTYDAATRAWATAPAPPWGIVYDAAGVCVAGFGPGPLFVPLGGALPSESEPGAPLRFADLANVTVYDPRGNRWLWQPATGERPQARTRLCAVGVRGPNGTHEIYIYGGQSATNQTLGDMFVLTLPGFHWFRIDLPSPSPRMHHACALVGRRQLLTSGGLDAEWNWASLDPWPNALRIVDLSTLAWSDTYDHRAADYVSPQPVRDWYARGGVESVAWSSDAVRHLFSSGSTGDAPTASPSGPPGPPGPSLVGPLVGGIIGGLALVSLLAAGLFIFLRRRRARTPAPAPPPAVVEAPKTPAIPDDVPSPSKLVSARPESVSELAG